MISTVLLTGLLALTGAGSPPQAAASSPQNPVIENMRVRVWDLRNAGPTTPLPGDSSRDAVVIAAEPESAAGTVRMRPRGSAPVTIPTASHIVVIELKDAPVPPFKTSTALPLAFPRPGSRKIFDTDRVFVWDYTWMPAQPTPMHVHDKDVVVVYLDTGDLRSTTPDNEVVVNHYERGAIPVQSARPRALGAACEREAEGDHHRAEMTPRYAASGERS
jgi:hypothetical protein